MTEKQEFEASLGALSDDEWLEAHAKLVELAGDVFPEGELDFVWDPDLDPQTLIDPDEHDALEDHRG